MVALHNLKMSQYCLGTFVKFYLIANYPFFEQFQINLKNSIVRVPDGN